MNVLKSIWRLLVNDGPLSKVFGKLRVFYLFYGLLSFEIENTDRGFVCVASKISTYFTVVALGANVVTSVVCLSLSPASPFASLSSGNLWLDKGIFYMELALSPVTSALHVMGRKWLYLFCKNLLEMDSSLEALGKVEPSSSHELKILVGTWALCTVFLQYIIKNTSDVAGSTTGVWLIMSWGKATFFFTQFQFVSAIVALRKRIEKFNLTLQYQVRNKSFILSEQRNKRTKGIFWTLSSLYEKLVDSAVCLNHIFCPVMLPSVCNVFLQSVYLSFVLVRFLISNGEASGMLAVSLFIVSSLCVLILGIQMTYCHSTYAEVRKIAIYTHKAYNSVTDEENLKDSILLFSKQLLGRRSTFLSCGLFILDITLLYSVASAISTYNVILVQFQFFS